MNIRLSLYFLLLLPSLSVFAQVEQQDSTAFGEELQEIVVKAPGGRKSLIGKAERSELITAQELTRAACCNLGESFTTNPSVDVSYTDAATGARQIRLLGLSGTYVQMLTENVPNFRGAASPFGLGYIPGPWMQSIQVSKGASSVKNGFESITGQINVEMRKPQVDPSLAINGYVDHRGKAELNASGNMHLGKKWSGGLLLHGENAFKSHDENGDGFIDMPKIRQFTAMNRWAYLSSNYVFQLAVKGLAERRISGQDTHHTHLETDMQHGLYKIQIDTKRLEAFTKNAFIFDRDNDGNVALILSGSMHNEDALYGLKTYGVRQREGYASLMFERKWNDMHALSAGLSSVYDLYHQHYFTPSVGIANADNEHEWVNGGYAQYTFDLDQRLILMGGLRYDYSSRYGSMVTPRLHARWNPQEGVSLNVSAGRGFRSPHPLAELNYLMASSRVLEISNDLKRESAWNFGAGASWTPQFFNEHITLSADYYFTRFTHQLIVNFDENPHAVSIYSSAVPTKSHSVQMELLWKPNDILEFGMAYRMNDVKIDYGFGRVEKPLQSRNKGLFTIGYNPMMGLWQCDASLSVNGGGRMPRNYLLANGAESWSPNFKAYLTLNAQVTRNFRHWSVYLGGENLTGYTQKNPIISASNPWGSDFDATMIYGPLHGAVVYVGFRYHFTKFSF